MIRKKSLLLLLVLTLVASMFLAACAPKDQPSVTPDPEVTTVEPSGTFVVGTTEASGLFNPLYYSSSYDGYVVDLVFDRLAWRNFGGEYEPGLGIAKDWEFSEDGKSITFYLKEDLVFSDGQPVTAHDVVFTFQVIADPSYTGRYGSYVKDLVGYEQYVGRETQEFEGVVALNDYTVVFTYKDALRVNFENAASQGIVPKHYYGKDYAYDNTAPVEAITSAAIGSGPYLVKNFAEKQLVYLERNDLFSGDGYLIKEIIMKFVEMTTEVVELTSGSIDSLVGVVQVDRLQAARDIGHTINSYPRSGYGYVKTNTEFGPTADPKVRQALYYSFNTKEFVNSYFKDDATGDVTAGVQYHPFSQVSWAIDDKILNDMIEYDFDLAKANQLLDEAGWVKNAQGFREKDGQVFELKIAAMPDHDILATLIPMWERDWGQGLGVKLSVAYLEFNTILDYVIYNSDANVKEWSLFFLATSIPTADPHNMYSSFHSKYIGSGQNNTSRYRNARVDELFDQAKAIMDVEEAKPYYAEIAKILNEEAVMMPVYANIYFDVYPPTVVDFKTNSLYNWTRAMKDARIVE